MSTDIMPAPPAFDAETLVVSSRQGAVLAIQQTCQQMAEASNLERFELAVHQRVVTGLHNDNDLRLADAMLGDVARASDALEEATRPAIAAAHAVHKSMIAEVKTWQDRFTKLRESLTGAILKYKKQRADLAARQQRELEIAAEAERKRKEA